MITVIYVHISMTANNKISLQNHLMESVLTKMDNDVKCS